MDVWVAIHPDNAQRVVNTLKEFGFDHPELTPELFLQKNKIIRMGHPPMRLEISTGISGVEFDDCYATRIVDDFDGVEVNIIDLPHLKVNKKAARFGSWLVPNSGCYCLTPRMMIQMKNWEYREELNREMAAFLTTIKTRKAYYPGSFELHRQFVEAHPHALQLGEPQAGHLPWTFIVDADAANSDDICFKREPFMSLYSETALEADNVVEFIRKAVEFANERLWGNLVASIVVHPSSLKDKAVAAAVDQAIADLRYGSIVINHWGLLAYYMKITPWGAYPGNELHDIQSGTGFVNNPLMFDRVQKSVIYSDFAPMPDTFLANLTNSYLVFRQVTRYYFDPNIGNLFNVIRRAMAVKKA